MAEFVLVETEEFTICGFHGVRGKPNQKCIGYVDLEGVHHDCDSRISCRNCNDSGRCKRCNGVHNLLGYHRKRNR